MFSPIQDKKTKHIPGGGRENTRMSSLWLRERAQSPSRLPSPSVSTKRNGAQALLAMLHGELRLRHILVRHEQAAMHAAEGR